MNLDAELHSFFKQTANHYNLALSELTYNILKAWKEEFEEDIKSDILRNLKK